MTEDDARTRWCPFAKDYFAEESMNGKHATAAALSFQKDRNLCRCIASDCMAWRTYIKEDPGLTPGKGAEREYGFCGLAGKP